MRSDSSMRRSPKFKWLTVPEQAIEDAINTPLPSRPPPARLLPMSPTPMTPYRRRSRLNSPPYFDSLTRSTMPTASLDLHLSRPPPILLARGHGSSSMDTLRTVQSRSSSTMISPASPNLSTSEPDKPFLSSWWFSSPKLSIDTPTPTPTPAPSAPPSPPPKQYLSPNNPIIFCHGLLGFDSVTIGPAIAPLQVTHWRGIKEVLSENGSQVLITRVPATSSPMDRAKVLEQTISKTYPGQKVHLIGHSMGGLDCRYLTTHLEHRQFEILSVTTIATPHRGSPFASTFLSTIGSARMPSILSLLALLPNGGGDGKAFESLTPESMRAFNEETPDVPSVRYFSWGATYSPGLLDTWKWPHGVILDIEGENDGLVSVESAKWGTYLGTLHDVNHLDLVGWVNTARYKWAEMMGKEIKFRPATFYLGVCDMLAREVEGQGKPDESGDHGKLERTKSQEEREQMVESLDNAGAGVEVESPEPARDKVQDRIKAKLQNGSSSKPPPSGRSFSTSSKPQAKPESKLELLPPTPEAQSKPEPKLELLPPTPP